MSTRTRILSAAAIAALVLAATLFGFDSARVDVLREAAPWTAAAQPSEQLPTAPVWGARIWQEGRRFSYALEHEVRLGADDAGPAMRLHGTLRVTTSLVRAQQVQIAVELEPSRVEPSALTERRSELAQPFLLELSREGTVRGVRFHPSVPADTRRLLRGLVGVLQSTLRPEARWRTLETDSGGQYRAQYVRDGDQGLTRRHLGYVKIATESGLESTDVVESHAVEALATYVLDDQQQVRELSSHQKLRMLPFRGGQEIRVRTLTSLGDRVTDHVGVDPQAWDALEGAVSLADDSGSREPEQRAADELTVGDASLDDIVGAALALGEMPSEKEARTEASRLFSKLGALARVHSSTVDTLHDLLSDPEPYDSLAQSVLIGGLGSAGTPGAREAVTDLLDADIPNARRNSVIIALHQQDETSPETAQRMLAQAKEADPSVADQALLALVSMTRTLAEGSDVDVLGGVLDAWSEDADTSRRAIVLDALGNSGDPRALPLLERTLQQAGGPLEDRAVFALRAMDDPRSRQMLESYTSEQAPESLRMAALGAVKYRPDLPAFRDALASLEQASDAQLRAGSASLLQRIASP